MVNLFQDKTYLAKLNSSGVLLWARSGECIYSDNGEEISCDIHGNIYVTGRYQNQMNFEGNVLQNTEMHNLFVAKYDSEGNFKWAKSAAGSSTVNYIFDYVKAICNDNNGNIYITGGFGSPTISFDNITLTRAGQDHWDIFLAKLHSPIPCSANFTLYPDSVTEHLWNLVATGYGMQPVSYYWEWGDGTTSAGANPSHTYSVPGYYNICLTITGGNGCSASYCDSSTYLFKTGTEMINVNVINEFITGVEEYIAAEKILLYPNPANATLILETLISKGLYQLIDITGKTVLQGIINTEKFTLDISTLNSGIYFISVSDGERQLNRKIIKE